MKMDFSNLTDKEILDIANPLMENIIETTEETDYKILSKDFTKRLKSIVTEEAFERQLAENDLGKFEKRELLSIIHKKHSIFVLWKQWFSGSDEEFLAEIAIVHKDGKFLVDHDWFR